MILFYEDWDKYPEAVVHVETKNKSFLRIARLYKHMGIKNHAFMLALHNPALRNIDPHDENLSLEHKIMIAEECKINPWYYFREVARVPPPAGNNPIMFRANRANIAVIWLTLNHVTTYLIQPRQTGKSLTANELHVWTNDLGTTNSTTAILTKDRDLADKTSRAIRDTFSYLPDYLNLLSKNDIKNSEKITVKALNNVINFYVGRTDAKAAANVARGTTNPITQIDEFAYVPNIEITLPVLLAASTAAREVAEQQGAPYFTLFTTTPGRLFTREGKFAYKVYKESMRWTEHLFDAKDREELEEIIDKNSRGVVKVVLVEMNHRQLGFTDEWLRKRLETALSEGEDAESDFLNVWITGGDKSPIDPKVMKIIKQSEVKNPRVEVTEYGYTIRWYVTESELEVLKLSSNIVIGLDTSDASGKDDIGLVIRDIRTGEVLGAGTYNETNLIAFADFIVDLLIRFPNAILIPERKSSMITILDYMFRIMLQKKINPFKRIFNWVVDEYEKYKVRYPDILTKLPDMKTIIELKKHFGFTTTGSGKTSRSVLYGVTLQASVKYTARYVRDSILIEQLGSLTIKNGRIDHEAGGHDDMVISWLLGYWFMTNANNKRYYGIKEEIVLSDIVDNTVTDDLSPEQKKHIKQQEQMRKQIERLFEDLRRETNEYIALRKLNKIRMLEKKLDKNIVRNFNIDAMLKDIKIIQKLERKKKAIPTW